MKGLFCSLLALALVAGCSRSPSASGGNEAAADTNGAADTASAASGAAADTAGAADAKQYASYTGDAAAGEKIFRRCQSCHSADAGMNGVGPSLHGVVGRKAGVVPGFHYSTANEKSGLVWSEAELFAYLKAPQKVVPGTYMTFPGLPKPQDRADVIAYLKTQSG